MKFKVVLVIVLCGVAILGGKLTEIIKKKADIVQSSLARRSDAAKKAGDERRRAMESISSGDESMDKELREVMSYEVTSPVIENFKKRLLITGEKKAEKRDVKEILYNFYLRVLKVHFRLNYFYVTAGIFVMVFSFLFYKSESLYHAVHVFSDAGFNVSRIILLLISVSALFFFLLVRRNIWSDCGGNVFAGPLVLFLCSAAALKRYDFNFPVFNRILGSVLFPAIVFAGIAFIA
ncbi:MAG: hypothetical protein ABIH68_02530 [bacterium]